MSEIGPAPTCRCAKLGPGEWRVYQLPAGFEDTLCTVAGDAVRWECIRRCSVCGQSWHEFHQSSGHAEIPVLEKVDRDRAEILLGKMMASEPPVPDTRMQPVSYPVERVSDRGASTQKSFGTFIALALIALGTFTAFYGAFTGDDSSHVLAFGGACFVLGIGSALFATIRG